MDIPGSELARIDIEPLGNPVALHILLSLSGNLLNVATINDGFERAETYFEPSNTSDESHGYAMKLVERVFQLLTRDESMGPHHRSRSED